MKKFYVTSPIYYTNGKPHLGHAYTTVACDVIARFKRQQGYDVFFLTGTDEHGQKVEKAAKEAKKLPKKFVDELVVDFQSLWSKLNISHDKFIRTTDKYHEDAVQNIYVQLYEKGLIYKGTYEGWYCLPDETFWADNQVQDEKCPECKRELKREKTESYFFKMSAFKDKLEEFFKENPQFIKPESRYNECYNFFKEELKDLSVSRDNFTWGIPLPFDKKHVAYVWFDALFNYCTAIGYDGANAESINEYWPADVHIVGKEIAKFHAVFWPVMLWTVGLKAPKQVYAHGWWLSEGQKMSKSLGNVVDPNAIADKYGADAFRYYVLKQVPFGEDGNFTQDSLQATYVNDLANEWGNLLNRTLVMTKRYCEGLVPKPSEEKEQDKTLLNLCNSTTERFALHMENLEFSKALVEAWVLIRALNKYAQDEKPWELAKTDEERLRTVLFNLNDCLRIVSILLFPVLPIKASEAYCQLGYEQLEKVTFREAHTGKTKAGHEIKDAKVLFPKVS